MTTRTIERPKVATRTKPPLGWRNKWRALVGFDYGEDGSRVPGEEYDGEYLHPSKDVAETVAAESLAHYTAQLGRAPFEYLGAFPVEGT